MMYKNIFKPFVNDNLLYLNNDSEGDEGVCIEKMNEKERKDFNISSKYNLPIYRFREFSKYLHIYSADSARRKKIIFFPTGEIELIKQS